MGINNGIVKWWDEKKGYGYITVVRNAIVQDYFAHYKNIVSDHKFKKLKAGWVVQFAEEKSEKGWMAKDICVVARNAENFPNLEETRTWLVNNEY